MRLDPRQLRILLTVVRAGSFSAAARQLNMSQPAVSMLIAQLERAVGAQLVERGRQGATPTQAGRILTRRAEMIETVLDLAQKEIELGMAEVEGPLIVGGTPGALMSLLPGAVSLLEARGTRYALRIVEATDAELITMLRELRVDLAVGTAGVGVVPDDILERAILSDSFVLVMRAGNSFDGESATLADLSALEWVLPDVGGAFQRQIEAMFLSAGVPVPQRAVRCDSLATTKEIIRRSNHVSILPHRVVASDIASGQLRQVALRGGPPPRLVGVRMLRDRTQMPLADQLVRAMADAAQAEHP
jgi:LysR family hydrogen peroxide-inducible transcriptional activator